MPNGLFRELVRSLLMCLALFVGPLPQGFAQKAERSPPLPFSPLLTCGKSPVGISSPRKGHSFRPPVAFCQSEYQQVVRSVMEVRQDLAVVSLVP